MIVSILSRGTQQIARTDHLGLGLASLSLSSCWPDGEGMSANIKACAVRYVTIILVVSRREEQMSCLMQKSAGPLPIRKAKFNPTPVSGQGITKFFDRKQEHVRE